jgi:hypothetical protein
MPQATPRVFAGAESGGCMGPDHLGAAAGRDPLLLYRKQVLADRPRLRPARQQCDARRQLEQCALDRPPHLATRLQSCALFHHAHRVLYVINGDLQRIGGP